ncbi:MAG TPA: hypothetical protein PK453_02685 [Leptospiraceae bacterium]|nr:hypothetical protein [Leptospiraceae bacterium]HMY66108.1 hypothetical protein [Leptospiraceae bacterium]HNF12548.1 hypothetical protein [Leptospiraceae bacterium]HNF26409.1 hypothetical protein [Leptospiraceae bacterium]HNI96949.1 hypothetical protein [Leptospiraceae bacterium]
MISSFFLIIFRVKNIFAQFFIISLLVFSRCGTDGTAESSEKKNMTFSIFVKAAECGNSPPYPLIPLKKSSSYSVNACNLAILLSPCPFSQYPLVCLEIFNKVDVPDYGPAMQND